MQIKPGEFRANLTYKYLVPILKTFGGLFQEKYASVRPSILAYGIQDWLYNDAKGVEQTESTLFIVLNRFGHYNKVKGSYQNIPLAIASLQSFLDYLRSQEYYVHDYIFDGVRKPTKHCVAIKLPDGWKNAYDSFVDGEYSKMYTKSEMTKCKIFEYEGDKINPVYYVLTHDKRYLAMFKKKLEQQFKLMEGELDSIQDYPEYEVPFNHLKGIDNETFNWDGKKTLQSSSEKQLVME